MSDTVPAYYVSTTGSDSNPGTLDAPFLTLGRAQEAMQSSSIKTTYIRAGDYSPGTAATVLNLGSSDSNETWSYYPADGYGSAHITGGGTITTFMSINGATGVTVNGLDISNFTAVGIKVTNGSSNASIINNTVHDMPKLGIALDDAGAAVNNTLVSNNYIYNIVSSGISIYSVHGNGNNNNTISNNSIVNAAYTSVGGGNPYSDGASIYAQDLNATPSTGNTIINNYIGTSHGVAIYLDDGASNFTVTGNILNPGTTAFALVQLHGGNNNVFSGNIGDVSTGLLDGFVFYQPSVNPMGERGMTGNVWQDNILVGSIASGGGNGYTGSLEPPAPLTIRNNDYWNYGAGGALVSTGSDGAGNDTNPTNKDPQLTGSTYNIAAGSPVFSSPVNFPGITGGWGPATGSTPLPSSPPPPPPPATLYGFVFSYNDGSYYFGTVADDGTYGYHTGETVFTSNTYGGNYYIYGDLGTTTNPVGSVHTTYYVDTTSGQGYDPYFYDHGNPADGSSGLGSEFDYTDGANGHQSYGGGGAYEAMQGGESITVTAVQPTGYLVVPDTAHLAALESGSSGSALLKTTPIANFTESGGVAGDAYTFTLGGAGAGSFAMSSSSGNIGTLSTGGSNVSAGNGVYALAIQVNDTSNGTHSAALPFDVWVGTGKGDTVTLATAEGSTNTPTIAYGLGGNDTINAGGITAPVWFVGGTGADTMTGGSGGNTYLYAAVTESGQGLAADTITNFKAVSDKFDFSDITGFTAVQGQLGTAKTQVAAHSIAWFVSGTNTLVYGNDTANAVSPNRAHMEIILNGNNLGLTAGDFVHH